MKTLIFKNKMNYIKHRVNGNDVDIDDFIHMWHTGNSTKSLIEFLGMNDKEYDLYIQKNDLNTTIQNHIDREFLKLKFIKQSNNWYKNYKTYTITVEPLELLGRFNLTDSKEEYKNITLKQIKKLNKHE
jgi:hypothetical protein